MSEEIESGALSLQYNTQRAPHNTDPSAPRNHVPFIEKVFKSYPGTEFLKDHLEYGQPSEHQFLTSNERGRPRRLGIDPWGEYWHFTTQSLERLFQETFPLDHFRIETYGNVLTAIAFLHGLAAEELQPEELEYVDRDYEVLISIRALKAIAS